MTLTIDTTTYRSENYNSRNGKPASMIMLHSTEGAFDGDARWLCDPASGVSCHYVIAPDGAIYQLVDEPDRAWHAGSGSWHGITDANSYSIGIEISHKQGTPYGAAQWDVTALLCQDIIRRRHIIPSMICAHRWYAPTRKTDPTDMSDLDLQIWIAGLYDTYGVWRNATVDYVRIREGPGTQYAIALHGQAMIPPAEEFEVDDLTPSDDATHPEMWLHLLSATGFVYSPLCEKVA